MRPNGQEVQDWRTAQEFRLQEMLLPKVATAPRKVGQVVSHCEVAAETAALAVLSMKEVVHDNDQEHDVSQRANFSSGRPVRPEHTARQNTASRNVKDALGRLSRIPSC